MNQIHALLLDPSFWGAVIAAAVAGYQKMKSSQHKNALASVISGVEAALATPAGQAVESMVKSTIRNHAILDGTENTVSASVEKNT